jgi:serine/threonine protein kinase
VAEDVGNPSARAATMMDSQLELDEPGARTVLRASRIGRYQILRELGSGGMGIVYAAYDESLDRRVALKLLLRETSTTAARLRREAQAMARISHPNVVQIFEVGEHERQLLVAMEFIEGVSLARWLTDESLTWSEIVDVFIRAGRGLHAAHEAGVVHRDFKPDNVMIQRASDGSRIPLRVKVLDFGIATVDRALPLVERSQPSDDDSSSRLTRVGARVGTPIYMAPEHALGNITDARSDQFSFAVALYEAVYGQRPFEGDTVDAVLAAVVAGKRRREPTSSGVPTWVLETLTRALAIDPAERWSSVAELVGVLADHPERTIDPALDRTVALRQRQWMLSVVTLGGLGLFGALLWVRFQGSPSGLEQYAFWSKILFASVTCVGLLAAKHVFQKNHYNKRVFAMVMALSLAIMATSICARAMGLSAEQTDRFALVMTATVFGQASPSVGRWLVIVPALALLGLVASFAVPFMAPLALGTCVLCGTGLTVYFWSHRRRAPTAGASGSDLGRASASIGEEQRTGDPTRRSE